MDEGFFNRMEELYANYSDTRPQNAEVILNPQPDPISYEEIRDYIEQHHLGSITNIPIVETRSQDELLALKETLKIIRKEREEEKKRLAAKKVIDDKISMISRVAEQIFPGKWDFAEIMDGEFKHADTNKYRLVIWFPHTVITNSKNLTHTIKDLYVQILFNKDIKVDNAVIFGNRTTRSYIECKVNYFHSHRRSGNYLPSWGDFCLGSNTPISVALMETVVATNEESLRNLLFNLDFYVEWESLEGGPFRRMEVIHSYNPNSSDSWNPNGDYIQRCFRWYIDTQQEIKGLIYTNDPFLPIKINRKDKGFIEQLKAYDTNKLGTLDKYGNWSFYSNVQPMIDGELNTMRMQANSSPVNTRVIYKGQVLPITIESYDTGRTPVPMSKLYPNPILVDMITSMLEERVNNYLISKSEYEFRSRHESS